MTRMWHIDPRLLCYQHLLGEHSEMHEGVGLIQTDNMAESQKTAMLEGQARAGNIDTTWFTPRHDALAAELERRGGSHGSPLDYNDELGIGEGAISAHETCGVLMKCPDCRDRIHAFLSAVPDDEVPRDDRGKRKPITAWSRETPHPFGTELEAIAIEFDDTRLDMEDVTA